jgi:hypothetical protein
MDHGNTMVIVEPTLQQDAEKNSPMVVPREKVNVMELGDAGHWGVYWGCRPEAVRAEGPLRALMPIKPHRC